MIPYDNLIKKLISCKRMFYNYLLLHEHFFTNAIFNMKFVISCYCCNYNNVLKNNANKEAILMNHGCELLILMLCYS